MGGDVLVPGCGFGYDAAAIAAAGASRDVLGIDIVPAAIDRAIALHARAGLRFALADYFATPPGSCDWIFEHTCYCAIDPSRRGEYVEAAWRALRPGGKVLAVFFLTPWDEDEDQEQGPPFGTTIEELDARFARRFELVESVRPQAAYPGREGRELFRLLGRKEG